MISNILGWVLNFEAMCMVLPLICSLVYGERYVYVYVLCMAICLFVGLLLTYRSPKNKSMYAKEGFITVSLSWIVISIFGALPFVISGFIPNYIDALFETVSGFTTTGATILKDVEVLPKSLLFWRSFTHWIGGMGVLVFLVAILPLSGGNNLYLIRAESTGPSVGKLVPKIMSSAKILYGLYLILTVLEIIVLKIGKLGMFETLTLTFGTAGTGGFAIKNTGLADYSPYVQNTIAIFMFLFGIDFSLLYLVFLGKIKTVVKSDEFRFYVGIVVFSTAVICYNCIGIFGNFWVSLRHSFFQVVSIITTTGYSTTDYNNWNELSKTILVLLMFSGACAGSTSGGIKLSRILILLKSIIKEVKIAVYPKRVYKTTMNGVLVEHETVRAVNVFLVCYIAIFVVTMLIVSVDNFGFATNFTSILATLSNIGPGLDGVGPMQNFSIFSPLSKLVFIFNMIAGRLEIFPILILFSHSTWKK